MRCWKARAAFIRRRFTTFADTIARAKAYEAADADAFFMAGADMKPKDVAGVASPELMKQATRGADYRRWKTEFLGG